MNLEEYKAAFKNIWLPTIVNVHLNNPLKVCQDMARFIQPIRLKRVMQYLAYTNNKSAAPGILKIWDSVLSVTGWEMLKAATYNQLQCDYCKDKEIMKILEYHVNLEEVKAIAKECGLEFPVEWRPFLFYENHISPSLFTEEQMMYIKNNPGWYCDFEQ